MQHATPYICAPLHNPPPSPPLHLTVPTLRPSCTPPLRLRPQNAVPTALNLQTLAVLYGNRDVDLGQLMFWEYLACVVTLPPFLMLFLHLATSAVGGGSG